MPHKDKSRFRRLGGLSFLQRQQQFSSLFCVSAAVSESCKSVFADQRINVIVPSAAGGGYDIVRSKFTNQGHFALVEITKAGGRTVMLAPRRCAFHMPDEEVFTCKKNARLQILASGSGKFDEFGDDVWLA